MPRFSVYVTCDEIKPHEGAILSLDVQVEAETPDAATDLVRQALTGTPHTIRSRPVDVTPAKIAHGETARRIGHELTELLRAEPSIGSETLSEAITLLLGNATRLAPDCALDERN